MTMKKYFLLIGFLSLFGFISAQVGINTTTPHGSAALDVVSPANNQGVLLPRMTSVQKLAISNPATGLLVYDVTKKCLSQNVGSESSPIWICLEQHPDRFFYMPSVAVDASALATGKTDVKLYDIYKQQFGTPMSVSTGAPVSIPYFANAADLTYYITWYDNTVIKINSISNAGEVNYDIIKVSDYKSFMNVVFVIK